MYYSGTNRGVSPVVGVILLIALTVIMAAVIGGFALGFATLGETASAGVSVDGNSVQLDDRGNTDEVVVLSDTNHVYELESVGSAATLPAGRYTVIGIVDGQETALQSFTVTEEDVTANGDYGLRFDNSQDHRLILGSDDYDLDPRDDSFTISLHASYESGTQGTVFLKGHTSRSYGIEWRSSGNIRFGLRDSNGDGARVVVPIDWSRHNSVLITAVYDASTDDAHLYINGEYKATADYSDATGDLYVTSPDWNIGGDSRLSGTYANADTVWVGDDARFYDRALTESEIAALSNGEHVTTGLIGHWPLNEGEDGTTTNVIRDADDSLSNGPEWTSPLAPFSQPRTAP